MRQKNPHPQRAVNAGTVLRVVKGRREEEGEEEGEVEGEGDGGIGGTERRNVFNLSCIRMYDEGSPARFIQQL